MFVTRLPLLHNVFVRFVYCQILAANKLQYDDTFLAWNIIPGWRLHAASGNRAAKAFAQVLRPPTSPYLPLMTTFLAPVLCCYHWMQESGLVEKIRNVSRIFCTSTCSFTSWAEVGHHNRRLHTRLKPGYFETVKVSNSIEILCKCKVHSLFTDIKPPWWPLATTAALTLSKQWQPIGASWLLYLLHKDARLYCNNNNKKKAWNANITRVEPSYLGSSVVMWPSYLDAQLLQGGQCAHMHLKEGLEGTVSLSYSLSFLYQWEQTQICFTSLNAWPFPPVPHFGCVQWQHWACHFTQPAPRLMHEMHYNSAPYFQKLVPASTRVVYSQQVEKKNFFQWHLSTPYDAVNAKALVSNCSMWFIDLIGGV